MPRACTVCANPERDAIDRALLTGEGYRSVAPRFAASPDAVKRHAGAHLPKRLAKATEAKAIAKADDLLAEVRALYARAHAILDTAEAGVKTVVGFGEDATVEAIPDLHVATKAIREARGCLELLAKLMGELQPEGTTQITNNILVTSPDFVASQRAMLDALRPFPEARAAVVAALRPLALAA